MPLEFSLILPLASRLLHPYSTDNKTSKLVVKRFSTERDTQRGSESYMKKRRGKKEKEVSRRRKSGTQEERDISMQYSVPYVFSTAQNTHRESQNWVEKGGGRRKYKLFGG